MGGEEGMRVILIILIIFGLIMLFELNVIFMTTRDSVFDNKSTFKLRIGYLIILLEIILTPVLLFQAPSPIGFYSAMALPFINVILLAINHRTGFLAYKI